MEEIKCKENGITYCFWFENAPMKDIEDGLSNEARMSIKYDYDFERDEDAFSVDTVSDINLIVEDLTRYANG